MTALMCPRRRDPYGVGVEALLAGHYRPDARYSSVVVNVTNRCNLSCAHCFVFRDANPNAPAARARDEPAEADVLALLERLRDRHGLAHALWMGGEPLLRRPLVERGLALFRRNTITTNGTIPLSDFGPGVLYVVSLDGPQDASDAIRGAGSFRRVLRNLDRLPRDFRSPVQVQCTVTRRNAGRLGELVAALRGTRVGWVTFSFYVPRAGDSGPDAWPDNEARAPAVREVLRLRREHPGFVRNSRRSLELMLPEHAPQVTARCPARERVLPLYLDGDRFVTPACCYGNDVDCARCGAWIVFHLAARAERPLH
jgi:MoaA/NifB/PqqE/SkfB family radical SAM enzyme